MVMGNGEFTLQGISLCGLVAVILNQILPAAPATADDLHEEQEYVEDMLNHARGEGDLWERAPPAKGGDMKWPNDLGHQ
jgi:uracil permease